MSRFPSSPSLSSSSSSLHQLLRHASISSSITLSTSVSQSFSTPSSPFVHRISSLPRLISSCSHSHSSSSSSSSSSFLPSRSFHSSSTPHFAKPAAAVAAGAKPSVSAAKPAAGGKAAAATPTSKPSDSKSALVTSSPSTPSADPATPSRKSKKDRATRIDYRLKDDEVFDPKKYVGEDIDEQGIHNTILEDGEWSVRRQKRLAKEMKKHQELMEKFPDWDFPSPDGVERPTPRVLSIAQDIDRLSIFEAHQLALIIETKYGKFQGGGGGRGRASEDEDEGEAPSAKGGAAAGKADGGKAAAPAAPAAPAQTSFSVKLESFDAAKKISVIKEVRAATGLGLKESKELVESAPKLIKKDMNKADTDALVAKLKEAGAKVVIE